MEYIDYEKMSRKEWDEACAGIGTATFNHTSHRILYDMEYAPGMNRRNLSFAIKGDKGIIAVIPLFIEECKGIPQFSNAGGYTVGPAVHQSLNYWECEDVLRDIFNHIGDLAIKYSAQKALFRTDPLANPKAAIRWLNYNYFMRQGYRDESINSQVIDLEPDIADLKIRVRRRYKSHINQGLKAFQIRCFDSGNITDDVFETYRLLHHKAAGRVTRPLSTFQMFHDWIRQGYAVQLGVEWEGRYIAMIIVLTYKKSAYYASFADDPEIVSPVPIGPVIQWSVIEYLKKNGFEFYETGWQQFAELPYDHPSEKDINISHFKRGFGGCTVPLFRGSKEFL